MSAIKAGGLMSPRTVEDAQRILADVEPEQQGWTMLSSSRPNTSRFDQTAIALDPWCAQRVTPKQLVLEALAAVTADDGPLDQLAWSVPTIGQTSAIAHRNSADVRQSD